VTREAIGGGTFVDAVNMTSCTGNTCMAPNELKPGRTMVKVHILPVGRVMAFRTIHAHLTHMYIQVTRSTCIWRVFECQILVAAGAGNINMPAHQRKTCVRMVEGDILPGGWFMTCLAVRAQFTLMRVILLVACETIHRSALEELVQMTTLAGNICMSCIEFKSGSVVIELGGCPAIGRVARSAICPQEPIMRITFTMTGGAVLGEHPEIDQIVPAAMAINAYYLGMFTG